MRFGLKHEVKIKEEQLEKILKMADVFSHLLKYMANGEGSIGVRLEELTKEIKALREAAEKRQ